MATIESGQTSFNPRSKSFLSPQEDVTVAGNYAYIAGESDLCTVSVSDPTHPTRVGFYDTLGYVVGVAVAGNTVYIADDDGGWLSCASGFTSTCRSCCAITRKYNPGTRVGFVLPRCPAQHMIANCD